MDMAPFLNKKVRPRSDWLDYQLCPWLLGLGLNS